MDEVKYRTPEQFRDWLRRAYEECLANDVTIAHCESALQHHDFDSREQMLTYAVVRLSLANRRLMAAEVKRYWQVDSENLGGNWSADWPPIAADKPSIYEAK